MVQDDYLNQLWLQYKIQLKLSYFYVPNNIYLPLLKQVIASK